MNIIGRLSVLAGAAALALSWSPVARAEEAPAAPGANAEGATGGEDTQLDEEGVLQTFVLERGVFVSSDLGVFLSLGGVNGVSNAQPYMALHLGYDFTDIISVQLSASAGYVSNNPISDNDDPFVNPAGQGVASYDLLSGGLEVVVAVPVSRRFYIEPKIGGGMTRINPAPTDPNDPLIAVKNMNPHVAFGADFKYLTLLTDFSAGLSLTGYYVLGPNVLALGLGGAVRYTF
jgi:hypothetical protein